jgi:hypothetical protein
VDPHPLLADMVHPAAPILPMHHDVNGNEEEDGWGHWEMGYNVQQEIENEMEVDLAPNAAFQGLLDAIHAEKMNVDNSPLIDSSSDITYSSRISNSSFSDNSANQQPFIHDGPMGMLPNNQMGEGLMNIENSYIDEEEDEVVGDDLIGVDNQHIPGFDQLGENNTNDFQLLDDVNMVPPQATHLIIGKVQTHFYSVTEEHDLTR